MTAVMTILRQMCQVNLVCVHFDCNFYTLSTGPTEVCVGIRFRSLLA